MKIKVLKILIIFASIFVLMNINSQKVYASEANEASVSANNCNVGENFTVTVYIPSDATGISATLKVTYSDGSTSTQNVAHIGLDTTTLDTYWPGDYTTTFPANVAGNATVALNNIVLSDKNANKINSSSTATTSLTISNPSGSGSSNDGGSSDGSTTPSQEPTPVNLSFSNTSEKMYTTKNVNIRQNYGTSSLIIQTLPAGTEVTRVGVSSGTADGYYWSRVSYNGITGYVITSALTTTAPEKEEEPNEGEKENPDENEEEQTDENNNEEKIKELQEELGTIPEVGINIMPFFFFGCVISCLIMMYEVKIKNINRG